jgi:hypothetical protein
MPADRYIARLWLLERDDTTIRPLVFADGRRIEIHGPSTELAMSTATVYLERRFGALGEPEHASVVESAVMGPPLIIE